MKQSIIHTEKDFGKQSGTSSHYRINCGKTHTMSAKTENTAKVKIQLMAVVEGDKPSEQSEYLMCQIGYRHIFIVAYLKGNGYVKLFTLHNFIEWYRDDRPMRSIDITQEDYNDDNVFEQIIERNFISLSNR